MGSKSKSCLISGIQFYWPHITLILSENDFSHFRIPQNLARYLKDGEVGPCLQVCDNLLGCPVVCQVARRRVLPLLQDADCSLGLLHHSQDAIQHLNWEAGFREAIFRTIVQFFLTLFKQPLNNPLSCRIFFKDFKKVRTKFTTKFDKILSRSGKKCQIYIKTRQQ